MQTVKRKYLSKMILFGGRHLRKVLNEFADHYHQDRPHQGIGNRQILPRTDQPLPGNVVVADERLGGLPRSYRRTA